MMIKLRDVAQAALLVLGCLSVPLHGLACTAPSAKTFNSGPLDPAGKQLGLFSEWVVDTNGVGLMPCNDSVATGGGTAPCVTTPVVPGNALSEALGRGVEGFFYLANSRNTTFDRTGAQALDWVIVLAQEAAFLSATPAVGFQTQFTRVRIRVNVAQVGNYTVETPWSSNTYQVTTLLPPGNGQNRAEISVPIDVTFPASATNDGLVTPYLIAVNKPALVGLIDPLTNQPYDPAQYIGDGITLTPVTGSPCGHNYVKITAVGLDGLTPIDINNGANSVTYDQFTISGKRAPAAAVPLAIGSATYTRSAGNVSVNVMAEGSTSATQQASMTVQIGNAAVAMTRDSNRFFATTPLTGALPVTVSVTAADPGIPSVPNTQTVPLYDLVTINSAVATCTGAGITRACNLEVNAQSSDDGSAGAVSLTLVHSGTPLVNGQATVASQAVPARVSVRSSNGGVATHGVTIVNQ